MLKLVTGFVGGIPLWIKVLLIGAALKLKESTEPNGDSK